MSHLKLIDAEQHVVGEGLVGHDGERLVLPQSASPQVYVLDISQRGRSVQSPKISLRWEGAQPTRQSANLIQDPGAELDEGHGDPQLAGWQAAPEIPAARAAIYAPNQAQSTSGLVSERGQGARYFAGSGDARSALRQTIAIDEQWLPGISRGAGQSDVWRQPGWKRNRRRRFGSGNVP